jgi:hypothetical protein
MNVAQTQYDVVRKAGKNMCNFKLKVWREDHEGAIRKGKGG